MPGSVSNAAPATVMPWNLCRLFAHERTYPVLENEYRNGESQRSPQATNSRKRWRLAHRVTPTALATLRDFYDDRGGPMEPFYFYDVWETDPLYTYDPTGAASDGRYTVCFDCAWEQTIGMGRSDVPIELIELA